MAVAMRRCLHRAFCLKILHIRTSAALVRANALKAVVRAGAGTSVCTLRAVRQGRGGGEEEEGGELVDTPRGLQIPVPRDVCMHMEQS